MGAITNGHTNKNAEECAIELHNIIAADFPHPPTVTFIIEFLEGIEAQARKEALREAVGETQINVHGRNPFDNGMRRGLKIAERAIEKLMEDAG